MPCRSPQTVSVAQPTPYLSMSQQQLPQLQPSQLLNGGSAGVVSQQQQLQQQLQAPPPAAAPPVPQAQQNGSKKPVAREGYNEKAMAVIRNSLRPFEQADQPLMRPVSSMSTGSSNNSNYSDCIQSLMSMGFDEVSRTFLI